ncbi:hypothetical protein Pla108_32520 [Botrimarina colliarenosi]|uniref:Uncharacterized protein n=1 Tax=Botrimarina colliarenosi TaxID=2528001 RepID=A0A5C6AAE4_9BACT|nr:hypothetical protein Pla108_32520 [Botrimarina colliarenosi]
MREGLGGSPPRPFFVRYASAESCEQTQLWQVFVGDRRVVNARYGRTRDADPWPSFRFSTRKKKSIRKTLLKK